MTASTIPALRIERIELRHVKQIESLVLEPNQNGVTVVHGDNESGKSTLIEAFNILISDSKVKSNKADVKALKPIGSDEKPMVEATLRIGQYRLTYHRVFAGSSSKATLKIHEPVVESFSGTEAFNKFREILGEHSDETLRSAMSIKQGDILNLNGLFRKSGLQRSIGRAAGEEDSASTDVSTVVVDEQTQWLMDRAREEREKYFTPRSRDKWVKAFATQYEELEAAEEAVAEARQQLSEVDRHTHQIERSKQDLARISADREKATQRVAELNTELEEVQRQEEQLETAAQQVARAVEASEALGEEVERRAELRATIASLTEAEAAAARSVKDAKDKRAEQENKAQALQDSVQADRLELDLAHATAEMLRRRQELKDARQRLAGIEKQQETAAELDKRRIDVQQSVDSNEATAQNLKQVDDALQEWKLAVARRDYSATAVRITGPEGALIRDEDLAVKLTGGVYETKVSGQRTFELGDFFVGVRPTGEVENHEAAAEQKRSQLIDALNRAGGQAEIDSRLSDSDVELRIADVREKADKRARLEEELKEVSNQLRIAVGGASIAELAEEADRLSTALERTEKQVSAGETAVEHRFAKWEQALPVDHQRDDLRLDSLLDLEAMDEDWPLDIQERLDQAQQNSQSWVTDTQSALQKAENHLATISTTVSLRREDLDNAEQKTSQDELEAAQNKAQQEVAQAQAKHAELQQRHQGLDTADLVDSKLRGKREEIRTLDRREKDAEQRILIAQHELDQAGGSAEELQEAEAHYQRLQSAFAAAERRANAANLLVQVFAEVHEEVKSRYQAPFLNEFTRLSKSIFGNDVSYQLDGDMAIEKRIVDGMDVPLDQLSGGATEQIAMLYRLAAASLMGRGESVPIFLDDTLGYTDAYRAENMNAVLSLMGREHQIIVTTCDISRFSAIGDAYVTSIEALQSKPTSG